MEAAQYSADDIDAAEAACAKAYGKITRLEYKLAEIVATNPEELKLKARYVDAKFQKPWPGCGAEAVAASNIFSLRAMSPPRPPQIRP